MGRFTKSFRAFWAVWARGEDAVRIRGEEVLRIADKDNENAQRRGDCVDLLYQLQTKARFVDFLLEDLDGLADAQVGAAVRNIHRDCSKVVTEYFCLKPAVDSPEGGPITLETGYDARRLKPVGEMTGEGPWQGILAHPGWVAAEVTLPARGEGGDIDVIAPAEIELGNR